ncbi:MAG: PAS domain-containing protein [Rhizomicrobium sp.]
MEFPDFCQTIASPALKAVALHWHEARGARKMPAWQDIKPKAIAPYLPIVWCYRFDAATGEFIGRLAGDRIARAYGKSFRGLPLVQAHASPERFAVAYALFQRVISEPAIFRGRGRIFQQQDRFQSGERIVLPLAGDGKAGDGVFGATETGNRPMIRDQPVEAFHDIGEWLSLK